MREYEVAVVFDLALAEADGQDAGPNTITTLVEARQGSVVKVDHWGRRRMAYPIKGMLDADYVITRVMLEPVQVRELETALRLNERVLRHLVVRADELPVPRQREEAPPVEARAEVPAAAAAELPAAPVADAPAVPVAAVAEVAAAEVAEAATESEAAVIEEAAALAGEPVQPADEAASEAAADDEPATGTSTTA